MSKQVYIASERLWTHDQSEVPDLFFGEDWENTTWHNDSAPSYMNTAKRVWVFVESPDRADRDWSECPRFGVYAVDANGDIAEEWNATFEELDDLIDHLATLPTYPPTQRGNPAMTTTATLPDTPIDRLRDSLARQFWDYCEAHKLSDELPADDLLRDLHDDPATPERDRHIAWLSAYIVAWEAMESADDAIDRLGKATRLS